MGGKVGSRRRALPPLLSPQVGYLVYMQILAIPTINSVTIAWGVSCAGGGVTFGSLRNNCIANKDTKINPIWLMRQAGRYLPEFREIRKNNKDFIKLCLSENLSSEITLQPIKRFGFDAAIIFSDILMLPYGLGQNIVFEKNFGPKLGDLNLDIIKSINESDFTYKLNSIYKSISITSKSEILKNRDLIGFTGAPWTIRMRIIVMKSHAYHTKKQMNTNTTHKHN